MAGTVSLGGVVAVESPVRRPGIKSGAASAEGRVRGKPPESIRGRLRRASGTGPTPGRSRGADLCYACGVGRSGMEARRGAGGGGSDPRAGHCLVKRSAPCKQSQEGDDSGSKQGTEAPRLPHESSTVAWATPAPGHSTVRAEGRHSPGAEAPAGCAPRRPCRAASAYPTPRRPPSSRRPGEPARTPFPCPGCRA